MLHVRAVHVVPGNGGQLLRPDLACPLREADDPEVVPWELAGMRACIASVTFFAARKLSRSGIDSERSIRSTVAHWLWCSARSTSKSSGSAGPETAPRPAARVELTLADLTAQGVSQRPLDVQVERIPDLIGLGVLGAFVSHSDLRHPVTAETVLRQVLEEILERPLADSPHPFGRELEPTLPLFDEAGLLESSRRVSAALPEMRKPPCPGGSGRDRGRSPRVLPAAVLPTACSRADRARPGAGTCQWSRPTPCPRRR